MFNIFSSKPKDVKGVRNAIVQFIKEQLKNNEGGEGGNIKSILLFIVCPEEENHIYRSAVYSDEPDKFKMEEVQRIADDYDIELPEQWKLEIYFDEAIPKGTISSNNVDVALQLITNRTIIQKKTVQAFISTLNGVTEKNNYVINSLTGKINIGREIKAQTQDGFFRKNYIAFIEPEVNAANRSVSRQHAHIEWNEERDSFYLFADEGGIPPHNKTKVKCENGIIEKIQTIEMGHKLKEGDQIILGEAAVLEFSLKENVN